MITDNQKQEFIQGYLTAALWSSTDTLIDENGDEEYVQLDQYEWADGEAETLHQGCYDFMEEFGKLLERYARRVSVGGEYTAWELAGHDFWLNRNGHGVGFWDRGLGSLGDLLSKRVGHSTGYPPIDLYLGDDETIYVG